MLLSFHVAAQRIPHDDESRRLLERALTTADRILIEGRDRVNRLRSEHLSDEELMKHIERLGADLALDGKVQYRVLRTGIALALKPHVVDEIFYIAREVITNAFRHSEGSEVDVLLDYQVQCFVLSCGDNGCGFDGERGKDATKRGHWGLRGMTERAQKVGGSLRCQSSPRGTQVAVSIPSSHAYIARGWLKTIGSKYFARKGKGCDISRFRMT